MLEPLSTRVFSVEPAQPASSAIQAAACVLRRGGLVAFPTETVYGLGADALDARAVERIFAAKNRPANDPIIVHVLDEAQFHLVAEAVPPIALALIRAFWPGPLTLILKRSRYVPSNVSSGMPTVAVRMPSGSIARALLAAAQTPIAAPSANTFSRPSATTAAHVLEDLNGRIDIVLDGGPTAIGIESSVLDLTGETPLLLRPGGVPLEALLRVVPEIQVRQRLLEADEAGASPGMLIKHYAPRAELSLYSGARDACLMAMREAAAQRCAAGESVGLLAFDDEQAAFDGLPLRIESLGASDSLETAASRLFSALRALDAQGVSVILARQTGQNGLGAALDDRLLRAAEGRVIKV